MLIAVDAYQALDSLRASATSGQLGALCEEHGVELLVVYGSVLQSEPLRSARDLDLAYRYSRGVTRDPVGLINALLAWLRFDDIDMMDLQRAGPVARARALSPDSEVLHEARAGIFVEAQIAAVTEEMETRPMRRRDLELLAGR